MNFTKSLIAASAVLLATTFASAQTAPGAPGGTGHNNGVITLTATIDEKVFIDVLPATNLNDHTAWAVKMTNTTDGIYLGSLLVETNLTAWDITVASANAGYLISGSDTLKAITGTTTITTPPARLQVFVSKCIATTGTPGPTTCPLSTTAISATSGQGKLAILSKTTPVSIATSFGKATATGFGIGDLAAKPASGGGKTTKNIAGDDDELPFAEFGIYGALYSAAAATTAFGTTAALAVGADKLTGKGGTYTETLNFTLASKF